MRAALFILAALYAAGAGAGNKVHAETPAISYIYPAGAQRGSETEVRVGGLYFHGDAGFHVTGEGITASPVVKATDTIWFEGPMIFQPASQKSEDYPKDHLGTISISPDAAPGLRRWHCRTSQGVTASLPFVVGDLAEIVEREIDGEPIAQSVTLPLTINGRIFPREDVDVWQFEAAAGEVIACRVESQKLGYPLEATLSVTGPDGQALRAAESLSEGDPALWFEASTGGVYQVRIHDANFSGLQNFVYRLTIRNGATIANVFPLGGRRGESVDVEVSGPGFDRPRTIPVSLADAKGDSLTVPVAIDGRPAGCVTLRVDDFPELRESGADVPNPIAIPAIANGRIARAGEVDRWVISLAEKQTVLFEIEAAALGSRLESYLAICDAEGKELAKNDDAVAGQGDSRLLFTALKSGSYEVKVSDLFESRAGPDFAYRLKVSEHDPVDFRLRLNKDAITVTREDPNAPELSEEEAKAALRVKRKRGSGLLVTLDPLGAFKSDVTLEVDGLPEGVSVDEKLLTLPFKKKSVELFFDAQPNLPVQVTEITVRGTATIGESDNKKKAGKATDGEAVEPRTVTREATLPVRFGEPPPARVRLAVAPHTPFRHLGQYRVTSGRPGGSTWVKHYQIERYGFDGPLTVSLADRQGRHLQGTTGPVLELPAGASEFDYPITYLPNPELGRTCRVQLMMVGEMTDFDGQKHTVSYTSFERGDQIITITSEGLLRLAPAAKTLALAPGTSTELPVRVQRATSIADRPVRVELHVPGHIEGVAAEPILLNADQDIATLTVRLARTAGPINQALALRAWTLDDSQRDQAFDPGAHVAESLIELVPQGENP